MTTGTKCCIHYKDGLPYCIECEKESDQRREELHAKLAETEQAGETLESKLAGAEIALEQARAEIEKLNKNYSDTLDTILSMLIAARGEECDIETLERETNAVSTKPSGYIRHCITKRDKLIQQMREALKAIDGIGREAGNARREDALRCFAIAAAALAAEGGE